MTDYKITVFNALGQQQRVPVETFSLPIRNYRLDFSQFGSGVYFVEIEQSGTEAQRIRFVVQ